MVAAVNSIRLLVVAASAPDNSRSAPLNRITAAQPPGPGFGLQPPQVQIPTTSADVGPGVTVTSSDAICVLVRSLEMEPQPPHVLHRILACHQRPFRGVQPIV